MSTRETIVTSTRGDRSWVLLTTSLVSSLIMLDSNVVAVSLPAIGRALGASFLDIQWVINAYVLTYAALLLAAGNFSDLHGRRKALVLGLIVFALSSAACGAAPSPLFLNLARAAQGMGGALLLTASLAIISHEFSGEERARAFAFWGASLGAALAVGPITGGLITHYFGWRWIFLVNVPVCALLLAATLRVVAESRDPSAKRIDAAGVVTFTSALGLVIWALMDGGDAGWTSATILIRLGAAAVLFMIFVGAELRQAEPMMDLGLFTHRPFVGAVLAMIGYGASAQVMVFFLPLFLQNGYGYGPMAAGVAMLPFALPMVMAPQLTSTLAGRLSGRAFLIAGLAITSVGDAMFFLIAREHLSYGVFLVSMLTTGLGAGLLNGQTVKVLSASIPQDRAGLAASLAGTTRFVGILVSVAAMGAVLAAVTRRTFGTAATAAGLGQAATELAANLVTSGDLAGMLDAVPPNARDVLHAAGLASFSNGFAAASLLAALVGIVACIATFFLVPAEASKASSLSGRRLCKVIDCRDPV